VAQPTNTSILLVAGDVSGDINTARLAKLLRERHPDWTLHAVGGEHLGAEATKSPGGVWIGNTGNLSAIGINAALKVIPRSAALGLRVRKFVRVNRVDAVVACDWGAFNCRQLDFFKEVDVPVLYYFPPSSWSRSGRGGLSIATMVNRVATPFEWSAQRLTNAGCKAEWVGHPMLEVKYDAGKRAALRKEFGIAEDEKLVALFPGSRPQEIKCLGPRLAQVAERLGGKGGVRFIVAAPGHRLDLARSYFPDSIPVIPDRSSDILFAADAAVVKSGTATLEAAVMGTPEVIVYDFPWILRLEWMLLWMWKKIPYIGMPNILLQRPAVTELLGFQCRPELIAQEVTALLENEATRKKMQEDYQEIRVCLGAALPKPATLRTAEMLEELLAERSSKS